MSVFDLMQQGGVLMWPILLCALLAVGVIIERARVLARAQLDAPQFMLKLKSIYRHADINAVLAYCSQKEAPIVVVARRGIAKIGEGDAKVREAMEDAGRTELYRLEHRLSILASCSGAAPMLGFIGAVIGMYGALNAPGAQAGTLSAAGMAGGIQEALLAMGAGLGVGIIAMIGHNLLVSRVHRIAHDMGSTASDLLDMLDQGPAGSQATVGSGAEAPALSKPALETEPEFFRRKVT